jgi:hypothetical protein
MDLKMKNNINILTFNRHYSPPYTVTFAENDYNGSYCLNEDKSNDYVLHHYARGYMGSSPVEKNTGLMPPGVKAIFPNIVVFERPPAYQNVFYIPDTVHQNMSDQELTYRVALPWQLYIAVYNSDYYLSNVYMYFMDGPLTSVDQKIYSPFIPNFFANGLLCRPNFSTMDDVERYSKDISGIITSAFDWVWNNGTNHDLTESMVALPKYIKDINSTVIKNEPDPFVNEQLTYKFSTEQVKRAFSSWEQIDIKDILNYKWPAPCKTLHDHNNSGTFDQIYDSSAYHGYLGEWLSNYYDDEDEESIEYRIDNDEYDQSVYISFLLERGYVTLPTSDRLDLSYKSMLDIILNEHRTSSRDKVSTIRDMVKITQLWENPS